MRTVKLSRYDLFAFDARYNIYGANVVLNSQAPHGATTRASRTLASDERGVLGGGYLLIMRATAPTTAGLASALLEVQGEALLGSLIEVTTAVGASRYVAVPAGAVIPAGSTVRLITADGSSGGAYHYRLGYNIIVTNVV